MNKNNNSLTLIDLVNILSFAAQVENIESDKQHDKYITAVFVAIANEIEKLHKENELILKKLEEIKGVLNDINK